MTLLDFTAPPADDEPLSVVPFPELDPDALYGLPGKMVKAVVPHTEGHPAPILLQFLAWFGAAIGDRAHLWVDNRRHPARINPLVLGKTSTGAKGTSLGAVAALFAAAASGRPDGYQQLPAPRASTLTGPLRRVSGLSSGEGLIELVRDASGDDPEAPNFDEGISDKRLLVVEEEFVGVLAVGKRDGNTLPRVLREAWDGSTLRTLTRSKPLCATGAHIVVIGHATPGEFRLKLDAAAMLGGSLNRFVPVASRRTKLLPDGGNLPPELLDEFGGQIADHIERATVCDRVDRTLDAHDLWRESYPHLRRDRPDGNVATILARAAPQVLRLALAYALADGSADIDRHHLAAALALWQYAEDSAEWVFAAHVDTSDLDGLVGYLSAGANGRTKTEITTEFYSGNKTAAEIDAVLGELIKDGRVRQQKEERTGPGRRAVRYHA